MNRPQSPDIYHQVRLAAANHRASHVCLQLMELRCHQNTVDEYQAEVLEHLLHIESSALPNLSLIQQQPEMNLKMRPLLLDFLMDVVNKLSLSKSTFPLTVNLIDRYCLTRIVKKSHYQLLGLTALWVACKRTRFGCKFCGSICFCRRRHCDSCWCFPSFQAVWQGLQVLGSVPWRRRKLETGK